MLVNTSFIKRFLFDENEQTFLEYCQDTITLFKFMDPITTWNFFKGLSHAVFRKLQYFQYTCIDRNVILKRCIVCFIENMYRLIRIIYRTKLKH